MNEVAWKARLRTTMRGLHEVDGRAKTPSEGVDIQANNTIVSAGVGEERKPVKFRLRYAYRKVRHLHQSAEVRKRWAHLHWWIRPFDPFGSEKVTSVVVVAHMRAAKPLLESGQVDTSTSAGETQESLFRIPVHYGHDKFKWWHRISPRRRKIWSLAA